MNSTRTYKDISDIENEQIKRGRSNTETSSRTIHDQTKLTRNQKHAHQDILGVDRARNHTKQVGNELKIERSTSINRDPESQGKFKQMSESKPAQASPTNKVLNVCIEVIEE